MYELGETLVEFSIDLAMVAVCALLFAILFDALCSLWGVHRVVLALSVLLCPLVLGLLLMALAGR